MMASGGNTLVVNDNHICLPCYVQDMLGYFTEYHSITFFVVVILVCRTGIFSQTNTHANLTYIPSSLATVVPKWSNRKPFGSVRKLFMKDAMVKMSESCSSCLLQSNTQQMLNVLHSFHSQTCIHNAYVCIFNLPSTEVPFIVAFTHRLLKQPSVLSTKTNDAQPKTAPANPKHSTNPDIRVNQDRTLNPPPWQPNILPLSLCSLQTVLEFLQCP